tara:strand:+ start:232 stop:810 length:579 start_codon:yes stop_codon:yes gene_type:complete
MTDYLPNVLSQYSRDFSNELSIDIFLKYGFYKICDAGLKPEYRFRDNPEVNPIQYNVVKGLEEKYDSYRELIYAIVIDGKIVKIGGTYTGMKKRHGSYNCGTRKARAKGTCSVTNFDITEYQFTALRQGKTVEWYVFDVPLAEATINLPWGEEITYNAKTYMKYESSLSHKYAELRGAVPPFNKQDTGSGGS